jgi:hypothetical protein
MIAKVRMVNCMVVVSLAAASVLAGLLRPVSELAFEEKCRSG